jgi:hypothetical protein
MSEQTATYLPLSQNPKDATNSELSSLKCECHRLIELVARRPGAIKLLQGAREVLLIYSAYKPNRSHRLVIALRTPPFLPVIG